MNAKPQACVSPWSIQIPKKVGIAALASFFVWAVTVTGGFAWYASRLEARVSALETADVKRAHVQEDLREIKTNLKWVMRGLDEVKQSIQDGKP